HCPTLGVVELEVVEAARSMLATCIVATLHNGSRFTIKADLIDPEHGGRGPAGRVDDERRSVDVALGRWSHAGIRVRQALEKLASWVLTPLGVISSNAHATRDPYPPPGLLEAQNGLAQTVESPVVVGNSRI